MGPGAFELLSKDSKSSDDKSFIAGLPSSADAVAIVRAIAGLAAALRMTTTAEGIETQEQHDQIQALGCTEMQGYRFSPPRALSDLWRIIAASTDRAAVA
jgi:EAL domain-containing protein (putative c-di-GMP-specific phosphodiesterase class I)